MKKFKENNKGFSLVELIVVIAIMVVLIAVLGSTILGYVDKSKYSKDISALDSINTAVKTLVADPSSTAPDGQYQLDVLIATHDKGNVVLPILAEVFAVGNVKAADGATNVGNIDFNNASKSFDKLTISDVKVVILNGAVSIYAPVETGDYAAYIAGNAYKADGTLKVTLPSADPDPADPADPADPE